MTGCDVFGKPVGMLKQVQRKTRLEVSRRRLEEQKISCKMQVPSSKLQVVVCQEGEEGNFKPCLIEDEGGPLEAAMQVEASNHRKLLW